MVQLRYANYPKDYFMGMLPSSQYGSVAVLPSTIPNEDSVRVVRAASSPTSPTSSITNPSDSPRVS